LRKNIARGISQIKICLSGQVLAEFYVNLLKKAAKPLSLAKIDQWIDKLSEFDVEPVGMEVIRSAILYSRRFKISYWDAAIVAAADRLGAPILYTEDLNHGQKYGTVTAINPFKAG
jgi:predicted nucleic acid-binding protein